MKSPEATAKPQCKEFQTISIHSQLLLRSHVDPEVSGSKMPNGCFLIAPGKKQLEESCCHPSSERWGTGWPSSHLLAKVPDSETAVSRKPAEDVPGSVPLPQHAQHPSTPTGLSQPHCSAVVSYAWEPARAWAELPTTAVPGRGSPITPQCWDSWDWNHSAS